MKKIRSRIHEFISPDLMKDLDKICNNVVVADNNIKAATIKQTLDNHGVYYNELGPGTNRLAVLIDGYVFKIAMDKWGKQDNANEFTMSKELQPFVIKVYENNDLISVSEYVTLISREEFMEKKNEILKILSILSESYLLGDVGYHTKNFTNWGYRDDGSLVILDFAYIHIIHGEEIFCSADRTMLEYDMNFHNLNCPKCGRVYTFSDIRKKILMEEEWAYINDAKNHSYQLETSSIIIKEEGEQNNKVDKKKEEEKMPEKEFTDEIIEVGYKDALDKVRRGLLSGEVEVNHVDNSYVEETYDDNESYTEENELDDFGSAVQLMRRLSGVENLYNDTEEVIDEEGGDNSTEEEVVETSVVTVTQPEPNVTNIQVVSTKEVEDTPEDDSEGIDYEELLDSISDEEMEAGEVITRSTPVTGVSILTGDSKVDTVVSEDEGVTITITNTEDHEEEDNVIEMEQSEVIEEKPAPKEDMLAKVYKDKMQGFRSSIRITHPADYNNEDEDEDITRTEETEDEKYERLARESGYDID